MFGAVVGLFCGYRASRDDRLPPSSTEVKNMWSYPSTPPCMFSWYGQGKINYIVTCILNALIHSVFYSLVHRTFFMTKGPHPLLMAGSRTTRVKNNS